MPARCLPRFRRPVLRRGALSRVGSPTRAPRAPDRVWLGRRVVSRGSSALMVVATGVATLALAPAIANAAGTASPGLPDVTIHATTASMTNGSGSAVNVTTACPSGSTLFGGGAFLQRSSSAADTPSNGLKLNGTIPSDASGNPVVDGASTPSNWTAVAGFGGQSEAGDQASAFANCATGGPTATVVKVSAPVGIAPLGSAPIRTTATCPSALALRRGAGCPTSQASFKPIASYPSDAAGNPVAAGATNPDSWSAYGSAGAADPTDQVTAFAVCSTDATVDVQVSRVDAAGPQAATTFTTTTAPCVAGDRLIGGGVMVDQGLNVEPQQGVHLRGSLPSDASGTAAADGAVNPDSWTGVVQSGGRAAGGSSGPGVRHVRRCQRGPGSHRGDRWHLADRSRGRGLRRLSVQPRPVAAQVEGS